MTQDHNKDIVPTPGFTSLYPDLNPLLTSAAIAGRFVQPENDSNSAKRWFNALGLTSLVLIISVLVFTAWRFASLGHGLEINDAFVWSAAVAAVLSFLLAIISSLGRFHSKWLFGRFVTERLREFKFQQLLDGRIIELSKTNPDQFASEIEKRLIDVDFSLSNKIGAMNDFIDSEDFKLMVRPAVCADRQLSEQIFDAYAALRLDYQAKYFKLKRESLTSLDDWTKAIAKFSLLLGGTLTVIEFVLILAMPHSDASRYSWIVGASALSAGLISGGVRVFRSGLAISEEVERYSSKWVQMKILSERFHGASGNDQERLDIIVETERVCIEELREFLRTFKKSDFLL